MNTAEARAVGLKGNLATLIDDAGGNWQMNWRLAVYRDRSIASKPTSVLIQCQHDLDGYGLGLLQLGASWSGRHLRGQVTITAPLSSDFRRLFFAA